jgi:hypothetical protein
MGNFAKNFLTEVNEKAGQRRNEDIFKKIKSKYGKDAKPEDIFKDVLESEGLDQEYKRNKLDEIKEYATLSTKNKLTPYQEGMLEVRQEELKIKQSKEDRESQGKTITPYQKKVLDNQETRLRLEEQRLNQAATTADKKLPQMVSDYTNKLLKDTDDKLPVTDKAELNSFVEQLMTDEENPMSVTEAFNKAYEYIQARRELINEVKIAERPTSWVGSPNPKAIEDAMEKAYQQLKVLHDEDGIDSQKDLRAIAKRGGWEDEEITKILQRIFQSAGKKFKPSSRQKSAGIPVRDETEAGENDDLDDILYGE